MITRTIATQTHGRYHYEERSHERLLVGFHGYAELAEWHFGEIEKIPAIDRWSVVAVQALHPFYTRSGGVVASWMTSMDRELAIEDNVAYVRNVVASLPAPRQLVFLGFSQGAAMAARAALLSGLPTSGLILLGGEIPPELHDESLPFPPVLLARGTHDEWYTIEKFKKDSSFLETRTHVTRCVFGGGHEWKDAFRAAAGEFLGNLAR